MRLTIALLMVHGTPELWAEVKRFRLVSLLLESGLSRDPFLGGPNDAVLRTLTKLVVETDKSAWDMAMKTQLGNRILDFATNQGQILTSVAMPYFESLMEDPVTLAYYKTEDNEFLTRFCKAIDMKYLAVVNTKTLVAFFQFFRRMEVETRKAVKTFMEQKLCSGKAEFKPTTRLFLWKILGEEILNCCATQDGSFTRRLMDFEDGFTLIFNGLRRCLWVIADLGGFLMPCFLPGRKMPESIISWKVVLLWLIRNNIPLKEKLIRKLPSTLLKSLIRWAEEVVLTGSNGGGSLIEAISRIYKGNYAEFIIECHYATVEKRQFILALCVLFGFCRADKHMHLIRQLVRLADGKILRCIAFFVLKPDNTSQGLPEIFLGGSDEVYLLTCHVWLHA